MTGYITRSSSKIPTNNVKDSVDDANLSSLFQLIDILV